LICSLPFTPPRRKRLQIPQLFRKDKNQSGALVRGQTDVAGEEAVEFAQDSATQTQHRPLMQCGSGEGEDSVPAGGMRPP